MARLHEDLTKRPETDCFRCGRRHKKLNYLCSVYTAQCSRCLKTDRFTHMCKSGQRRVEALASPPQRRAKQLRQEIAGYILETGSENKSPKEVMKKNKTHNNHKNEVNRVRREVSIKGRLITFLADAGADVTLINAKEAERTGLMKYATMKKTKFKS